MVSNHPGHNTIDGEHDMAEPKYVGRDCELSTTATTADGRPIDPYVVTNHILRELPGALEKLGAVVWTASQRNGGAYGSRYSTDCHRNWSSSGMSVYCDMSHVEVCTPSCLDPLTFASHCIASLIAAEAARTLAQANAEPGTRLNLAASNADLLDPAISFGSHESISVSRALWENLFEDHRWPGVLGTVVSGVAASMPFFGAGYLLPWKNGLVTYSLSARAHQVTKVSTLGTTTPFGRGLLNSRRENHGQGGHERMHLIGFDFAVLSEALLCTFLQCLLAAAEEGFCGLGLIDPLRAMRAWSWKIDLATGRLPECAALMDGRQMTLPAYMRELATKLLEMCEAGLITPDVAPRATELLPLIIELTRYAEEGSVNRCARHLGWASKLLWLLGLCQRERIALGDPQCRLADHDYSNTDPEQGAFWKLWEQGMVDPLVTRSEVEAALTEAPPESRDWGRGAIIHKFSDKVVSVDWSYIELEKDSDRWSSRLRIDLPHLHSLNRAEFEPLINEATSVTHLEDLLQHAGLPGSQADPLNSVQNQLAVITDHDISQ